MFVDNNSGEIHILYNGDLDVSNGEHFLHGRTPIALELHFFCCLIRLYFFQPVSPHLSSTACMLRQMRALQPLILESTSPSTLHLSVTLAWTWTAISGKYSHKRKPIQILLNLNVSFVFIYIFCYNFKIWHIFFNCPYSRASSYQVISAFSVNLKWTSWIHTQSHI